MCRSRTSGIIPRGAHTKFAILEKNELKPWLKKSWCFPKEADAEFVYHMEDVLDVYCQPYDPGSPPDLYG